MAVLFCKMIKVKKIIYCIFINLLVALSLAITIDHLVYKIEYNKEKKRCFDSKIPFYFPQYAIKMKSIKQRYENEEIKNFVVLNRDGNSRKKPILVMGCSFAYGLFLNPDKTFSSTLSRDTRRIVYNRAVVGWGIQHMLYQLRRDDFYHQVKEPEYLIYVVISDHMRRLRSYVFVPLENEFYLRYEEKSGKLVEIDPKMNILRGFYLIRFLQTIITENVLLCEKNRDKNFDFAKLHFEESRRSLQSKYPNTKFVILKYMEEKDSWFLNTQRWNELEKEGFIVLDTNELTGKDLSMKEYKLPDNHPNEKAWEIITPALINKLKL